MKIEPLSLTVRQLCDGYADHAEDGVVAYGGKLDIRPKYQREFIYSEKQQQAVINTAMHGYPLNTMYRAVRGDGTFEVIDGQQRTASAPCTASLSFSRRCTATTRCRGRRAATPRPTTSKCSAVPAI